MNAKTPAERRRRIGIMQGRLSPRPQHRLQAFPTDSWENEFELARRLGIDGIEWIFEAERASENPLRTSQGRARIRQISETTGTKVLSVCGDYFMVHRLSEIGTVGSDASKVLSEVIAQAAAIGAQRILLPWLEEAALDTQEKEDCAVQNLNRALPAAERHQVMLGLEMEIPGERYRALIERFAHPLVRAYYDTGNSTAQGIDIGNDITHLRQQLGAVHIKDRKTHGGTQFLGKGDTNFEGLFSHLNQWDFHGDLVLQHYFEDPENDAAQALGHIRAFWPEGRVA